MVFVSTINKRTYELIINDAFVYSLVSRKVLLVCVPLRTDFSLFSVAIKTINELFVILPGTII